MGADRDPSAGKSGSVGFAAAVAEAMSATAAVTSYRFGLTEAVSGGVRVIGTETSTWPSDTTFAAAMHADGQTVVLDVNSISFGMTREAARILGAELSRLGREPDGAADATGAA